MQEFETVDFGYSDTCNECRNLEAENERLKRKLQAAQDWIDANSGDMPTPDFTR